MDTPYDELKQVLIIIKEELSWLISKIEDGIMLEVEDTECILININKLLDFLCGFGFGDEGDYDELENLKEAIWYGYINIDEEDLLFLNYCKCIITKMIVSINTLS